MFKYAIVAVFMLAVQAQDSATAPETTTSTNDVSFPVTSTPVTRTAVGLSTTTSDTGVAAPSSTTNAPAEPSSCILGCVQPAAAANGCVYSDVVCVCASAQFQQDALDCLTASCTPDDVAAAEALQQQQCGAIGVTLTNTATTGEPTLSESALGGSSDSGSGLTTLDTTTASTIPGTTAASTTPGTTAASTTLGTTTASTTPGVTAGPAASGTSNAAGGKVYFGYGELVALGAGAAGLLAGGGLVL